MRSQAGYLRLVGCVLVLAIAGCKKKEGVAKDLDFLFGGTEDSENDDLERKFWALLRAMQKKGLLSREEFLSELEKSER